MSPGLDGFMEAVTFLGTIEFYILFIPLLYWCVDQKLGLRVLFILILTAFPASSFKQLLHEPRPYWLGGVKALADEASYGIPSSHASNTLAVWGLIASTLKKSWSVDFFHPAHPADRTLAPGPWVCTSRRMCWSAGYWACSCWCCSSSTKVAS